MKVPSFKSENFSFQMDPSQIAFLKFVLEGYDHLANLTVCDPNLALVKISFYPSEKELVLEILKDFSVKYLP